ncbi:unnamed protein product [Amoebophrya sp. A25]|nr:unnamed protein product [Amoebophrya sp. A25]|eukprot:GSA25T00016401001.1
MNALWEEAGEAQKLLDEQKRKKRRRNEEEDERGQARGAPGFTSPPRWSFLWASEVAKYYRRKVAESEFGEHPQREENVGSCGEDPGHQDVLEHDDYTSLKLEGVEQDEEIESSTSSQSQDSEDSASSSSQSQSFLQWLVHSSSTGGFVQFQDDTSVEKSSSELQTRSSNSIATEECRTRGGARGTSPVEEVLIVREKIPVKSTTFLAVLLQVLFLLFSSCLHLGVIRHEHVVEDLRLPSTSTMKQMAIYNESMREEGVTLHENSGYLHLVRLAAQEDQLKSSTTTTSTTSTTTSTRSTWEVEGDHTAEETGERPTPRNNASQERATEMNAVAETNVDILRSWGRWYISLRSSTSW